MSNALLSVAVFAVLGIMAGWKLPYSPALLWGAACVAWLGGVVAWRRGRELAGHGFILTLVVCLAAFRCQTSDPGRRPDGLMRLMDGERHAMELVVAEPPEPRPGRTSLLAEVIWIELPGGRIETPPGLVRVTVHGPPGGGPLVYGSRIRCAAILRELPTRFSSPWSDTRTQDLARGIVASLALQGFAIHVHTGRPPSRLRAWIYGLRDRVATILAQTHDETTAGVLGALLFGERDGVTPALWNDFRRAGTVHLLAQSGLHVGIVAMVAYATLAGLRLGRTSATLGTLMALVLFCLLAGERASVLRATLMASFLLVGRLLDRRPSHYASLAAAALVLLAADPQALALPGFQLSFIATLGLLYLSPPLLESLSFLPTGLASLVAVSLAAFLATAPLTLYHFDAVPLVSPVANLVVVPLVGVILPCALLTVAGGMLSPWLAFFFGAANYGFVTLLRMATAFFASPSLPLLRLDVDPLPLALVWYLALVVAGDPRVLSFAAHLRRRGTASDVSQALLAATSPGADADLFRDVARLEGGDDLASRMLHDARPRVESHLAALRAHAPDAARSLAAILGSTWDGLGQPAAELVLFAETWRRAGPPEDLRPALAALVRAVELELEARLFGPLRHHVLTFPTPPRGGELTSLAGSPPPVHLPQGLELLWLLATPGGPSLEPLVLSLRGLVDRCLPDGALVLDASRLPLLVDHLVRRVYWKLPLPEAEGLTFFLTARDLVVGGPAEGLLSLVGRIRGLPLPPPPPSR